jgi:hypothetical protein
MLAGQSADSVLVPTGSVLERRIACDRGLHHQVR